MPETPATLSVINAAPVAAPVLRWPRLALLLLPLFALGGYFAWRASQSALEPPQVFAEHSLLRLDLTRPDALIESVSLARLPRDLLRIPWLRDVLSEDFVFYYENNADRLGLVGSLRRIAYEHELQLRDSLIEELLDQPGEIALWRGQDGKLRHALLRLRRGALAKALQPLALAAADDSQLSRIGVLAVDGDETPIYRLRYNYDRALLLIPHNDELMVLSSAQMLQSAEAAASAPGRIEAKQLAMLFEDPAALARRFGLEARKARHRLTVSADYLALGYGRFVPQLAGLRMEMDAETWRSFVGLNQNALEGWQFAPLWQAMPMNASLCAAVPLSSETLQPLFTRFGQQQVLPPELAAQLRGPVALCWYGKSRLHTPLLVGSLSGPPVADVDESLARIFAAMIGTYEAGITQGRFPVESRAHAAGNVWQRVVGSSFGLYPAATLEPIASTSTDAEQPTAEQAAAEQSTSEQAVSLSHSHYFRVSLARHGDLLLFSLDDALVTQALATLDKRYPPLAEQLPQGPLVTAYIAPAGVATLLEQETLESLPTDLEAVFRNAAETHLLPRLRALGQHGPVALTLPPDAKAPRNWTWLPLNWAAL